MYCWKQCDEIGKGRYFERVAGMDKVVQVGLNENKIAVLDKTWPLPLQALTNLGTFITRITREQLQVELLKS